MEKALEVFYDSVSSDVKWVAQRESCCQSLRVAIKREEAQTVVPIGIVRAKSDAYGGTFVQWMQLPVAGMELFTRSASQVRQMPMTEAEIKDIARSVDPQAWAQQHPDDDAWCVKFAQLIEAHYKIGVKP